MLIKVMYGNENSTKPEKKLGQGSIGFLDIFGSFGGL